MKKAILVTERCNRQAGAGWLVLLLCAIFLNPSQAVAEAEYLLGGGDTVNISVYEQPDLSTVSRISPETGAITYPLLGEVKIAGLTPESAGKKIATLLKEKGILKFPEVTLSVQDYLSQSIPVMGQVNRPGEYPLTGESRVVDLIAQAGGVQEDAADIIVVVKHEDGKQVRHEIDLLRFYAGDMSQNIKVSEGDFILVPKMDTFYIHGEVQRPGSYRLERGMTAMQALSVGGGLTERGSLKGMKVTRTKPDGSTESVSVGLTDKLKPNDVLYVKERLF